MTVLAHVQHELTIGEAAIIAQRAALFVREGTPPRVARSTALEEFISHRLPDDFHLAMAEEIA